MLWLFGQIWVWLLLAFALGAGLTAGVLTMGDGRLEPAGVRTALAARSRSARHALAKRARRVRGRDTGESGPPAAGETTADVDRELDSDSVPGTDDTGSDLASRGPLDDSLDDRVDGYDEFPAAGDDRDGGRLDEDALDSGPPTVRYGAYAYDTLPYDGRPYVDAVGLDAGPVGSGTGTRVQPAVADAVVPEPAAAPAPEVADPALADPGDDGPCDVGHREGTLPMPAPAGNAWPDRQDVPSARR